MIKTLVEEFVLIGYYFKKCIYFFTGSMKATVKAIIATCTFWYFQTCFFVAILATRCKSCSFSLCVCVCMFVFKVRNSKASGYCLDQGSEDDDKAILYPCHGMSSQVSKMYLPALVSLPLTSISALAHMVYPAVKQKQKTACKTKAKLPLCS